MTYDKNGILIHGGDIVEIKNAYVKRHNGLYYVEEDGTNEGYAGSGLTLEKICKNGKISKTKYNIAFWPLFNTMNDRFKRAEADQHNAVNATIEKVNGINNSFVVDHFRERIKADTEQIEYWEKRFDNYESPNRKSKEYCERVLEYITGGTSTSDSAQTAPEKDENTKGKEDTTMKETSTTEAGKTAENKDQFERLAAAYVTGKSVNVNNTSKDSKAAGRRSVDKAPTPETDYNPAPEKPLKEAIGYTGESSEYFTADELSYLTSGEALYKKNNYGTDCYIAVKRDESYIVQCFSLYRRETIEAGMNTSYFGFIHNNKFYGNDKKSDIVNDFVDDVEAFLQKKIPNKETAEKNARNYANEYELDMIYEYKNGVSEDVALRYFYEDDRPHICLYDNRNISKETIFRYITNPESIVKEIAETQMENNYMRIANMYFTKESVENILQSIIRKTDHEAHNIKRIMKSVSNDFKTVKITISNGETVTVEANAVKRLGYAKDISEYYVKASDRKKLPLNKYNRHESIQIEDIKKITHGGKVLYIAA